ARSPKLKRRWLEVEPPNSLEVTLANVAHLEADLFVAAGDEDVAKMMSRPYTPYTSSMGESTLFPESCSHFTSLFSRPSTSVCSWGRATSRAENLQIFRSKEAMEPISVRATLSGPLERSPRFAPCVRCGHRRPQRKLAPVLGACMGAGLAVARKVRRRATDVERPLESLVEVQGEYIKDLPAERLAALRAVFPELSDTEKIRLVSEDPPVLLLEQLLSEEECEAFVESMRDPDGSFPERLGQANLDVPGWLTPLRAAFRGVPVLDWLGNPTVRWTYRSRCLLDSYLQKVRDRCGLDLSYGAANIKHYRQDQWLPVHIDYNRATLMTYLNEVGDGGHTLFPTLGIKVKPARGSALVWPNQPPLKHAGDAVKQGEKWILFYNWPAEQNWEYDGNFEFNA
ncbi:unnamed protein product, partial [Effrenium voratum]